MEANRRPIPDAITRQIRDLEPKSEIPHVGGLEVLCAGLWRTGTTSLHEALEGYLGFSPCLHGGQLVTRMEMMKVFYRCCVEEDDGVRRRLLGEWFDGYPSATDLPGWAFVEDLVVLYPEMRLILNKRSSAAIWLDSAKEGLQFYASTTYFLIGYFDPYLYWHHQIYVGLLHLFKRRHGISSMSEMFSTRLYDVHNQWVRDVARKYDRPLLEYQVSEGWTPLANFLELDIPRTSDKEIGFPTSHERSEMQGLKMYLVKKGLKAWGKVVIGPLLGVIVGLRIWYSR